MRDAITARVQDGSKEIDILFWIGRTALELIGQGGLGYSLDPLTEDSSNEYAEAVKSFQSVFYSFSNLGWHNSVITFMI